MHTTLSSPILKYFIEIKPFWDKYVIAQHIVERYSFFFKVVFAPIDSV